MSACKTKINADHLIMDYRELERKLGKQPTCLEYAKKCHSISSLVPVFGRPGWGKLLKAVGAKPHSKSRKFTIESVHVCYRRLKAKLGRVPDRKEFERKCCSCSTLRLLYGGGGWKSLLKDVGDYQGTRSFTLRGPSKTAMLNAFHVLSRQLGKTPKLRRYQKITGYTLRNIKYRFGENGWEELVKHAKKQASAISSSLSAEHLIQDFLELQQKLGRRPSISEYLHQCHTPKVLDRVFGKSGWKNMISAAGDKALPKNIISADHLVEDYIVLCLRLGKKPVFNQFRQMHRHTLKVLDRAFGKPGWSNLVIVARRKMRKQL